MGEVDLNFEIIGNRKLVLDHIYQVGSSVVGPYLNSFLSWVKAEAERDEIDQIWFLARDGQLPYRGWLQRYARTSEIKPTYIYGSRLVWRIASLGLEPPDWLIYQGRGWTVSDLCDNLNIRLDNFNPIFEDLGFAKVDSESSMSKEEFVRLCRGVLAHPSFRANIEVRRNVLHTYLCSMGVQKDRIAVVDVGWNGSLQEAVVNLFPESKIHGYYLGVAGEKAPHMKGMLFGKRQKYFWMQSYFGVVEMLTPGDHGQLVDLRMASESEIEPILGPLTADLEVITGLHAGALDYLRKATLPLSKQDLARHLKRFVRRPNSDEIMAFQSFAFGGNHNPSHDSEFISRTNSVFIYFLSPLRHLSKQAWPAAYYLYHYPRLGKVLVWFLPIKEIIWSILQNHGRFLAPLIMILKQAHRRCQR